MRDYDQIMVSLSTTVSNLDLHKVKQTVKWSVYTFLLINYGLYVYEDVTRALHTLHANSTYIQWTGEFATTLDTTAWLVLLLMFELETYTIDDAKWTNRKKRIIHGTRIVCFILISHTVFAYSNTVVKYSATQPIENVAKLCDLADKELSFVDNLKYSDITLETCEALSKDTQFFRLGQDPLVVSETGLSSARDLALADLIEIITWLVILFSIEVIVRQQGKDIVAGRKITLAKMSKSAGYTVLLGLSLYWVGLGHWLYTWDTFVWIAGFAAIEVNINEWKNEIVSTAL